MTPARPPASRFPLLVGTLVFALAWPALRGLFGRRTGLVDPWVPAGFTAACVAIPVAVLVERTGRVIDAWRTRAHPSQQTGTARAKKPAARRKR